MVFYTVWIVCNVSTPKVMTYWFRTQLFVIFYELHHTHYNILSWSTSILFFYTIVRRPSVRPSVCVSVRSKLLLLLAKWSDPHKTCTQCSPGRSASTMCSRSKVTRYGQFCCSTKIAPGRSQMDGSCTDMVTRNNCKMGMSYHVIDGLVQLQ